MNEPKLSVRLHGLPTGVLRLRSGSMYFEYDRTAAKALSLSMPLTTNAYRSKACEAFFGGLLPEDPDTKKVIARLFGINSNSNFSLLEQIGFDCAGAVSLQSQSDPVVPDVAQPLSGRVLDEDALYELLRQLPERPLLAGIDGIRISLAGAQEKAALCVINNELCIPANKVPSTHIIKPRIRGLQDSVANEYFCMRLSNLIGLVTPHVEVRSAKDIRFLLIERYDRTHSKDGISRLHQEDFCQALGIVSTKKYQQDGGPTLADCFELLNRVTFPAADKLELLKRVVFNYILANTDCHGKNFSILHKPDGSVGLAPVYDVLCTAVYSKITPKFAMSIGGESEINSIRAANWTKFCKQCDMNSSVLRRVAAEVSRSVELKLPIIIEELKVMGLWNDLSASISTILTDRITMLQTSMNSLQT